MPFCPVIPVDANPGERLPDDYLTSADNAISRSEPHGDVGTARLWVAEAQVSAKQAVAAAIDRLAAAVENLQR